MHGFTHVQLVDADLRSSRTTRVPLLERLNQWVVLIDE